MMNLEISSRRSGIPHFKDCLMPDSHAIICNETLPASSYVAVRSASRIYSIKQILWAS